MTEKPSPEQPKCDISFRAVSQFNSHGYAFQRAILAETERLFAAHASPWIFEAEEFPVSVKQHSAHIDFVLKHLDRPIYIVAECKRVGSGNGWCFASSAFERRENDPSDVVVDFIAKQELMPQIYRRRASLRPVTRKVYHQGVAFQSSLLDKKPKGSSTAEAIHSASVQAFLGASGFINWLAEAGNAWREDSAVVIPVLITTAPLFTLAGDLSDANLQSGNLSQTSATQPVEWLWLRQHTSPSNASSVRVIRSDFEQNIGSSLSRWLDSNHSRTLAVVHTSGIASFLAEVGACTVEGA
ncbi:hypothetical protein [Hyphococcus sp.]|uniref:hypothetical protein n=1 Tax=Hyphococcus sp. TaxID=2038636 RepID=UPI00207F3637|nr:MAG: hypothetical protein DHS20C04_31890 [Marinicaulis sp.]